MMAVATIATLLCLTVVPAMCQFPSLPTNVCKHYGGECHQFSPVIPVGARYCFDQFLFLCPTGFMCCILAATKTTVAATTTKSTAATTTTTTTTTATPTLPQTCGIKAPLGRIWGGVNAQPCAHPWQASLRFLRVAGGPVTLANSAHECGGTLVDPQWVLTTPECFLYTAKFRDSYDPKRRAVIAFGDQVTGDESGKEQLRQIDSFHLHPGLPTWTSYTSYNISRHTDPNFNRANNAFVLVKLNRPVDISNCVRHVCLPAETDEGCGCEDDCYITGWGFDESGRFGGQLKQGLVKYCPRKICDAIEHFRVQGKFDFANAGCAFGANRQSACLADDGGPIVCERNGTFVLRGTSILGHCATNRPFPAPAVGSVVGWIKQVIQNN